MAMSTNCSLPLIVITGPPGIGKTTLVCKLIGRLKERSPDGVLGFYTIEKRGKHGSRIGFNFVTTTGEEAALSFIKREGDGRRLPMVGRYAVDVAAFERVALPHLAKAISSANKSTVLVIDEVAKMELFSNAFVHSLSGILNARPCALLLTIPLPGRGRPLPLVDTIRKHPQARVVILDLSNRDDTCLQDELFNALTAPPP